MPERRADIAIIEEGPRRPESEKGEKEKIFYLTKKERDKEGKEVEKKYVSVMGIELEVNEEGAGTQYQEAKFRNFSLDAMSQDLLKRLAIGIKLDQPILIEGETDIGKTQAIEYLAFLTNHHLEKINLSGQTDVSEFVGRFMPANETAKQRFLQAINNPSKLKRESREILEAAREEGRNLTEEESEKIAVLEKIPMGEAKWIWQDGALLRAAKHNNGDGTWLYIDEMGGAEPAVLLRLNPALDPGRRFPVSELGGEVVESGPKLRFIASTNPPEYAGNEPFRPDYLRRWVYQSVGGLDQETLNKRLAFVMRGVFPEKPELAAPIREVLIEFHAQAKEALKTLLKQRQVFRYEFSDLARVVQYVDGFGREDIEHSLYEAVKFYYLNKLKDIKDQIQLVEIYESLIRQFNTIEKIKKLTQKEKTAEQLEREAIIKAIAVKKELLADPKIRARIPKDILDAVEELIEL